jgi:hypothetical protein
LFVALEQLLLLPLPLQMLQIHLSIRMQLISKQPSILPLLK